MNKPIKSCPRSGVVDLQSAIDKHPLICPPDVLLREVLLWMVHGPADLRDTASPHLTSYPTNYVLVFDQQTLVGIFTEHDVVRLSAQELDFSTVAIADVMTRQLVTCSTTDPLDIGTVLALFRQHGIRHLPLLDEQAQVEGVFTTAGMRKALQPSILLKMRTVQEVMNDHPLTAPPTASVMEIAQLMSTQNSSCVVIIQGEKEQDSGLRPIGIITERDIVQYQLLELDFSRSAQEVMSCPLDCLRQEDTLANARQNMENLHIRRMVVIDSQGNLSGLITQANILAVLDITDMVSTLDILQQQVEQLQNEKIQLLQTLNSDLEQQVEEDVVVLNSYQNYFAATFEQAPIGIAHINLKGQFFNVNQWFCDWLQYTTEDLLQRSLLDITHAADRDDAQWLIQQLIQGKRSAFVCEQRYLCQDGSTVWGKVTVSLARTVTHDPDYLIAVVEDISDRKGAELALQQLNQQLEERVVSITASSRASEQRYRTLFESAPDMLFVLSQEGEIQQVNVVAQQRSGYAESDLLNQPLSKFLATVPQPPEQLWETLCKYGAHREVSRLFRPDGTSIFVDCAYSLIHDQQGSPLQILVIQRDINEQIQTAAALTASEARYRSLYQNTPVMLHSIDPEGCLVSVSNLWLAKMGYQRCEVLGRASTDFLTPASQAYAQQEVLPQFFQTGLCQEVPYQFVTKQGDIIDVLLSAITERDDNGELLHTLAVSTDVTERNRFQSALGESEERFRIAFEAAAIGMALISPEGQWLKVNEALCHIVGYSKAELLGMGFQQVTHSEDLPLDEEAVEQLLLGELKQYHTEKRYIHKQGHEVWVSLSASMIFSNDGQPLHFITQIQNINDRKVSEQQLSDSLSEKNVMLQEIHHRVKNNLQVICSLLSLQNQVNPDLQITEIMQESQHRIQSMALVHENLYRSKNFSKIDLASYIQELTNNLLRSYRSRASSTQINIEAANIELNIDISVPCGLIINELVSNSLKYAFPQNRDGVITINITENTTQELIVTVADNGIGLPPTITVDHAPTLGLRMVNTLVKQISGTLTICRNSGTEFRICFPLPVPKTTSIHSA